MKKIALALAALTMSAPALAQDDAPFSGAHASGVVGYDVVDLNTPGVKNPDGVVYGLGLGYDIQKGAAVFGVEGEVTGSSADLKAGAATIASMGRDLYVGGRLGYASGRTLVYTKVGYSNARVKSVAGNADADGIRIGAGVEQRLGGNLIAKAEYRYTNYEAGVERHQAVAGIGIRF
jgi:outer membrane immunogenic protein